MFVQILDRAIEELNTDRPLDVPVATKRRSFPGEKPPAGGTLAVFLGDETLDPPRGSSNIDSLSRRRLPMAVQCVGATDDVALLDEVVEPHLVWATRVLGQSRLGGLVHYVRETAVQRAPEYIDLFVMRATVIFEVSYHTLRRDITASN